MRFIDAYPEFAHDPVYNNGAGPRKGDWIQTFTGKQFWPLDARPEGVCIEDIAHALSNLCRFGGHCREFYSVAQHSVLVARHSVEYNTKQCLLHDATEAYLVDVPRPIKKSLPEYQVIEEHLARVIGERFGIVLNTLDQYTHLADECALRTERRDLMATPPRPWAEDNRAQPWPEKITPWPPKKAERVFLAAAKKLGIR
jgi:hypothetical protein